MTDRSDPGSPSVRLDPSFPPGVSRLQLLTGRWGSLDCGVRRDPACFWIVGRGAITPSLIRSELGLAEAFGREHPKGWSYVVDTRAVSFIHPFNAWYLRNVRRLPNNRQYIIIARPMVRILAYASIPILRPTRILTAPEQALTIAATPVAR